MRFCSFLGPAPVQEGIEGPDESRTVPRGGGLSGSQIVPCTFFAYVLLFSAVALLSNNQFGHRINARFRLRLVNRLYLGPLGDQLGQNTSLSSISGTHDVYRYIDYGTIANFLQRAFKIQV